MNIAERILLLLVGAMILIAVKEGQSYMRGDLDNKVKVLEDLAIMQNKEYQDLRKKTERIEKRLEAFNNAIVLHDKEILTLQNKGVK
jgi:hypothetical protein